MLDNFTVTQKTDELKKLIFENPELPIVVLAGEDANSGYWGWMYCSNISFGISEILDYDIYDYDDSMFTDRDKFEEKIADDVADECDDGISDEEFDELVRHELEKYEPYWKKVIAIYADN